MRPRGVWSNESQSGTKWMLNDRCFRSCFKLCKIKGWICDCVLCRVRLFWWRPVRKKAEICVLDSKLRVEGSKSWKQWIITAIFPRWALVFAKPRQSYLTVTSVPALMYVAKDNINASVIYLPRAHFGGPEVFKFYVNLGESLCVILN